MRTRSMRSRSLALAALSAAVACTASAQASLALPEQSVFMPMSHYNRHGPGPRNAGGATNEGRVELRAARGGRVTVTDVGESSHYSLTEWGHHETASIWSHRWTGRMVRRGDALAIDLTVATTSCRTEEREHTTVVSTGTCDLQRDLALRCEPTADRAAWSCSPSGPFAGPASPGPWLFTPGRGCLQRLGGMPSHPMQPPEPCATP